MSRLPKVTKVVRIRGNRNIDMSNRCKLKYPNYNVLEKSRVRNGYGDNAQGGFKYYQDFLIEHFMSDSLKKIIKSNEKEKAEKMKAKTNKAKAKKKVASKKKVSSKDKPLVSYRGNKQIINKPKLKILRKFIKDEYAKKTPEQKEHIKQLGIKYSKQLERDGLLPKPKKRVVGSEYHKKALKKRGLDKKQSEGYYEEILNDHAKIMDNYAKGGTRIPVPAKPMVQPMGIKRPKFTTKDTEKKSKFLGTTKVLGKSIDIYNDLIFAGSGKSNPISITHSTEQIICSEIFTLLDIKIQEFAVTEIIAVLEGHNQNKQQLEKNNGKLKISHEQIYFNADKKAFLFSIKKYPKTPKLFWLSAVRILVGDSLTNLNLKRLKKMFELLKSKKDKETSKKAVSNYAKKLRDYKKIQDADMKRMVGSPDLVEGEDVMSADTLKFTYPKSKLNKKIKELEKSGYKPKLMQVSFDVDNLKVPKRKGWKTDIDQLQTPIKARKYANPKNADFKKPIVLLAPVKQVLMRSKRKDDMVSKIEVVYSEYKILQKGLVLNNTIKGFPKYAQSFIIGLKTNKQNVVSTEYKVVKTATPKKTPKNKPMKLYSMDELSDKTLGKIGTPLRDKMEKAVKDEVKRDRLKNKKKSVKKITKKK